MSFLCKSMEQCRLWPAKLWSNKDLALLNHRDIVSGPKINNKNYLTLYFLFFFLACFVNQCYFFQRSIRSLGPLYKENIARIAKHCPDKISSVVKLSKGSYEKTLLTFFFCLHKLRFVIYQVLTQFEFLKFSHNLSF